MAVRVVVGVVAELVVASISYYWLRVVCYWGEGANHFAQLRTSAFRTSVFRTLTFRTLKLRSLTFRTLTLRSLKLRTLKLRRPTLKLELLTKRSRQADEFRAIQNGLEPFEII